jgi:hypothetical protein
LEIVTFEECGLLAAPTPTGKYPDTVICFRHVGDADDPARRIWADLVVFATDTAIACRRNMQDRAILARLCFLGIDLFYILVGALSAKQTDCLARACDKAGHSRITRAIGHYAINAFHWLLSDSSKPKYRKTNRNSYKGFHPLSCRFDAGTIAG